MSCHEKVSSRVSQCDLRVRVRNSEDSRWCAAPYGQRPVERAHQRKKLPETGDRKDEKQLSELKQAWEQIEATRAEVEVLRKTMVVLAENQRMDEVLDTLLRYVHEVVPYTSATVLFDEEGGRLFVAR
jgi:hypothetical protein